MAHPPTPANAAWLQPVRAGLWRAAPPPPRDQSIQRLAGCAGGPSVAGSHTGAPAPPPSKSARAGTGWDVWSAGRPSLPHTWLQGRPGRSTPRERGRTRNSRGPMPGSRLAQVSAVPCQLGGSDGAIPPAPANGKHGRLWPFCASRLGREVSRAPARSCCGYSALAGVGVTLGSEGALLQPVRINRGTRECGSGTRTPRLWQVCGSRGDTRPLARPSRGRSALAGAGGKVLGR